MVVHRHRVGCCCIGILCIYSISHTSTSSHPAGYPLNRVQHISLSSVAPGGIAGELMPK